MATKPHAIRRHDHEPFEVMFKRWKRAVEKDGLLQELRAREFFEKPSMVRKRAKAAAVKRNQRKTEEERAALNPRKYLVVKKANKKRDDKKRRGQ